MALPAATFAQDAGAPPGRVGQITSVSGSVSFNGSGSGGWAAAADNYPVSAGDSLYTQDHSGAGIVLDASQVSLASDTELQVTALDEQNFAATESQGEVALAIDDLQPGQVFTITTPRGTVSISQDGQYDIIAGDADTPTTVNVFQGQATVAAPGASLQVAAGQAGVLSGADQTVAQLGQAQQDAFSSAVFAENTAAPPAYAPPVVDQMTGVGELGQYGQWQQSPQYGAVWYPSVGAGWTPYREGHWADIQPWGWTWVESEPWGFAPFHYGRWIDDHGQWGWAPAPAYSSGDYGPGDQPVYAPAVVGFFGLALAAGITAAALSSGSVGWVPLAPNEPYYPTYHCPPAYIRRINIVNVRNINEVHVTNNYYYGDGFTPSRLANHRAATFIPADVMRSGERVGGYAHTPGQDELAAARPIDTGFGHPGAPAAFRLPEARPLAELRPAAAPRRSDFAERSAPPAIVAHTPFNGPGAAHEMNAIPMGNKPEFATEPFYHAPPAPPKPGEHLSALPPGNFPPGAPYHPTAQHPEQAYHPPAGADHPPVEAYHPPAQVYHPPAPAYHPPEPAYHPAPEAYHPPAPEYHPEVPAYHPQAPAYHPQEPAYHPQEPAYHPQEQFHPSGMAQPRPMEAPHPEQHAEQKHPG